MTAKTRSSVAHEALTAYRARDRAFKKAERALRAGEGALETSRFDSERMGRIRQKGTKPELLVRQVVSALGHRYRTKNRDLPGSPDLANRRRAWAIFVHGCYWHAHPGCSKATVPKHNRDFWLAKFARNRERDRLAQEALQHMGYRVVVVWECETRDLAAVARALSAWPLDDVQSSAEA